MMGGTSGGAVPGARQAGGQAACVRRACCKVHVRRSAPPRPTCMLRRHVLAEDDAQRPVRWQRHARVPARFAAMVECAPNVRAQRAWKERMMTCRRALCVAHSGRGGSGACPGTHHPWKAGPLMGRMWGPNGCWASSLLRRSSLDSRPGAGAACAARGGLQEASSSSSTSVGSKCMAAGGSGAGRGDELARGGRRDRHRDCCHRACSTHQARGIATSQARRDAHPGGRRPQQGAGVGAGGAAGQD